MRASIFCSMPSSAAARVACVVAEAWVNDPVAVVAAAAATASAAASGIERRRTRMSPPWGSDWAKRHLLPARHVSKRPGPLLTGWVIAHGVTPRRRGGTTRCRCRWEGGDSLRRKAEHGQEARNHAGHGGRAGRGPGGWAGGRGDPRERRRDHWLL